MTMPVCTWLTCAALNLGTPVLALGACSATPEPVPPKAECSAESCPVRFVVIAEVPDDDPIAPTVSAGQNVVDAIEESDAGEVEWIDRAELYP